MFSTRSTGIMHIYKKKVNSRIKVTQSQILVMNNRIRNNEGFDQNLSINKKTVLYVTMTNGTIASCQVE